MTLLPPDQSFNYKEHAVSIYFYYDKSQDVVYHELGKEFEKIMRVKKLGFYDGFEVGFTTSEGCYFLFGPDAEAIFKALKPAIDACAVMRGARATLCFGQRQEDPKLELQL